MYNVSKAICIFYLSFVLQLNIDTSTKEINTSNLYQRSKLKILLRIFSLSKLVSNLAYWKTVDWEVISDLEPMFGIELKGQVFSGWNLWLKHIFSFFDLVGWTFRQLENDSMPLYTCTTWNEISSFNINFVCIIYYADFFTR